MPLPRERDWNAELDTLLREEPALNDRAAVQGHIRAFLRDLPSFSYPERAALLAKVQWLELELAAGDLRKTREAQTAYRARRREILWPTYSADKAERDTGDGTASVPREHRLERLERMLLSHLADLSPTPEPGSPGARKHPQLLDDHAPQSWMEHKTRLAQRRILLGKLEQISG
ncbi:hypothetical protein Rhopal_007380-T1 [Rhodotorula paludigena]|uniref:Uncharacterized protein n=1 Tax=Rhodotorula paludigena TaxID=86838 RepID=A0AAV5GNZ2_9BASI|nr:hypothetical protein Rhopal_007380-T1 [Rhodotorula paludigena]